MTRSVSWGLLALVVALLLATGSASAAPRAAGSRNVGGGSAAVRVDWPRGALSGPSRLVARRLRKPAAPRNVRFAVGTRVVKLAATHAGKHVRQFARPVVLTFPRPAVSYRPAWSRDGKRWVQIPKLPAGSTRLPAGWPCGWRAGRHGKIRVRTLHPGRFGLLTGASRPGSAVRIRYRLPRAVVLGRGHAFTLRVRMSLPARVSVTLARGSKRLATWHVAAGRHARDVRLGLPAGSRRRAGRGNRAGRGTVTLRARVGGARLVARVHVRLR